MFAGWGTDEAKLIEQIACRKVDDLIVIQKEYKNKYGKDLVEVIKDECSGDFEDLLIALMYVLGGCLPACLVVVGVCGCVDVSVPASVFVSVVGM